MARRFPSSSYDSRTYSRAYIPLDRRDVRDVQGSYRDRWLGGSRAETESYRHR